MTPLSFRVLRALADGEFHSGAAIARALGVSRATVWNALAGVEQAGVEVFRVHGRGYRLREPIAFLDPQRVARALGPRAAAFRIEVAETVESTNSALMARAAQGAPRGTVLVAEWQTQGRGRRGRAWESGLGGALTFSVLERFAQGVGALSGLSLAVGLAVARAAEALGAGEVALKWPNDVLWRGHKLAGILIEVQGDALGPSAAVIGVGINTRLGETVRNRIDQAVADLDTACGRTVDRNEALGRVLDALAEALSRFGAEGFAPLRADWERRHFHQGRRVRLTQPDGSEVTGTAVGVGDDGALVLQTDNGLRRYASGEVSLRTADAGAQRSPIPR